EDNNTIEKYSFNAEINFSGLFNYLLSLNLSTKIELIINDALFSDEEKNLINLINKIIDSYNEKVDELKQFMEENP
ncbi:MAG: hypothetical protein SOU19_00145, partial [Candidatus Caccosoma sp.]|nr:hypothetical protein [Candidatus Caccosoma sp.]